MNPESATPEAEYCRGHWSLSGAMAGLNRCSVKSSEDDLGVASIICASSYSAPRLLPLPEAVIRSRSNAHRPLHYNRATGETRRVAPRRSTRAPAFRAADGRIAHPHGTRECQLIATALHAGGFRGRNPLPRDKLVKAFRVNLSHKRVRARPLPKNHPDRALSFVDLQPCISFVQECGESILADFRIDSRESHVRLTFPGAADGDGCARGPGGGKDDNRGTLRGRQSTSGHAVITAPTRLSCGASWDPPAELCASDHRLDLHGGAPSGCCLYPTALRTYRYRIGIRPGSTLVRGLRNAKRPFCNACPGLLTTPEGVRNPLPRDKLVKAFRVNLSHKRVRARPLPKNHPDRALSFVDLQPCISFVQECGESILADFRIDSRESHVRLTFPGAADGDGCARGPGGGKDDNRGTLRGRQSTSGHAVITAPTRLSCGASWDPPAELCASDHRLDLHGGAPSGCCLYPTALRTYRYRIGIRPGSTLVRGLRNAKRPFCNACPGLLTTPEGVVRSP
ncbi:hypothetical protein HPB52_017644 [Rhipicephalus sanguineus]|uniref:Uncharacterized protein n=1 Tax=Rhipicephalus sanguineus TaxID=34632 RepID=A0A9D4Q1C5_RHISA|nr:hypothetical protein HPB52_017644 [Rhipicephalus sanguineus]